MFDWHSKKKIKGIGGFAFASFLFAVFFATFFLTATWGLAEISELENIFFGVIAITAAFVSVRAIQAQIYQQVEQEERRNRRKLLSLRSALPLQLSELYRSVNSILIWHENPTESLNVNLEDLEKNITPISSLIEYTDEETGQNIAEFLSIFQILKTRLEDNLHSYVGKHDIDTIADLLIDDMLLSEYINWAAYRSLMPSFFDFAHGKTLELDTLEVTKEGIEGVLNSYYSKPGTSGPVPEKVEQAKNLLIDRVRKNNLLENFWKEIGVEVKF